MIDMDTYRKIHKKSDAEANPKDKDRVFTHAGKKPLFQSHDTWPTEVKIAEVVDDRVLMILPPSILGFEMQTKRWGMS